jgi:DNA polymerase-3 subunit epsilon
MLDRPLEEIPVAVLDFETTGLSPKGGARVVEVAVARAEPGTEPVLAVDTLIHPEGPVLCSDIHGIEDADVIGAPRFAGAGHHVIGALSGAIVATYNAGFDLAFLQAEAEYAWPTLTFNRPPYVCLMWLRPLLGVGRRCSLEQACSHYGLLAGTHRAAEDALLAARLWRCYLADATRAGARTLRGLQQLGSHTYLRSFASPLWPVDLAARLKPAPPEPRLKPRSEPPRGATILEVGAPFDGLRARPGAPSHERRRAYWRGLLDALEDGALSSAEHEGLLALQEQLALSEEEIRAIHARLLANVLAMMAEDDLLTRGESSDFDLLMDALRALGWAPGYSPS